MSSLNIKAKVTMATLFIFALLFSTWVMLYIKLNHIQETFERTDHELLIQDTLKSSIAEALQIGQALRNIHINPKDTKAVENLATAMEILSSHNQALNAASPEIFSAMKEGYEKFFGHTKALYEQAKRQEIISSTQIQENTGIWRGYKASLQKSIDAAAKSANENKKLFAEEIVSTTIQLSIAVAIVGIVILLIMLLGSSYFIKAIDKISHGLDGFFAYLEGLSQEARAIDFSSGDELGKMAAILNQKMARAQEQTNENRTLLNEVKKIAAEMKEGHFRNEVKCTCQDTSLMELKGLLNEIIQSVSQNVSGDLPRLLALLDSYAAQDFTARYENAKGKVAIALNQLGDSVSLMLSQNTHMALELEEKAKNLRASMETLSQGTNEQAASLEESAAAIEEMSSSMGGISHRAEEVSKQTEEIRNVIMIIRDIADQTNLLA
ncbi:methyl-accepting chemotaxis protein, partial [Wolinella succinogenes]|uniref:methyl-accepting chemotaxis protein n=1 Tax=Wolinella succinogenes TaxID=844 RepID=UPI002FC7E584